MYIRYRGSLYSGIAPLWDNIYNVGDPVNVTDQLAPISTPSYLRAVVIVFEGTIFGIVDLAVPNLLTVPHRLNNTEVLDGLARDYSITLL